MERLDRIPLNTSFSLHSVADGSEVISEVEEIQEVCNLQHVGDRALKSADYDEALRCYEDALEIDNTNIESLCGRSAVYLQLGKFMLAQLDAERVLAIQPHHLQALELQGEALGELGYHREALVNFLKVLEILSEQNVSAGPDDPSNTKTAELVDNIAHMASKYCSMPDKLLQKLPALEGYRKLCEVGVCLYQAHQYQLTVRVLTAANKLQTNQKGITMKLLLTLANANSALKHGELAITLYQECLNTARASHDIPYQTKSLVSIASLFLELGDTHQAIMYYEKLYDLQQELKGEVLSEPLPDYWSDDLQCALHLNMSIAYKSIGDMKHAMKHANIYLKLIEGKDLLRNDAEALSRQNLGVLLDIVGNHQQALEHFHKFLVLSREKGDKAGVVQAYGSLGSVYGRLSNTPLSHTYHKQCVSSALRLNDSKLITASHEQYGDTATFLKDLDLAVDQYLLMYKSCDKSDPHSRAKALCKVGKVYRAHNQKQYSIYYFEQANTLAEANKLSNISTMCEFNLACILQFSTQLKELTQARHYLESLIPQMEARLGQHQEEDTFCSDVVLAELHECYSAIQLVLSKLGENNLCLSYAEAAKWQYMGQTVNPGFSSSSSKFTLWSEQRLCQIVDEQNATVLYYMVHSATFMLWVLQPGKGIVSYYQSQSHSSDLAEYIREEVSRMKVTGRVVKGNELQYDNRSLPYKDEEINVIRKKYKFLSSSLDKQSTKGSTEMVDTEQPKPNHSAEQVLFKLLVSPVYDLLTQLEAGSPVVIVPDASLFGCPFGGLKDWSGVYMGERFTITNIPCLYMLEELSRNEADWKQEVSNIEQERSQSRLGGVANLLNNYNLSPLNSSNPDQINLRMTSNPRLVTSGALQSLATTKKKKVPTATLR